MLAPPRGAGREATWGASFVTLLVVDDLEMRFGERLIQTGISFTLEKGTIFAIMGGSGCGKSTLLKHLIGLMPPAAYLDRTLVALDWSHLGLGFAKSFVFGALIGMVGCYFGLYAQRNAAGVGVATTNAVVTSIVGIIVLDAIFAICANALGI